MADEHQEIVFQDLLAKYEMTAYRLSKVVGIPKRTVTSWGNGTRKPPEWTLRLIDYYLEREWKKEEN